MNDEVQAALINTVKVLATKIQALEVATHSLIAASSRLNPELGEDLIAALDAFGPQERATIKPEMLDAFDQSISAARRMAGPF